jgi:hypothetical protein
MPISKIETQEYECVHCGYKWVNRVNGKDGPVPKRCAKCKRFYWNDGQHTGRGDNPNPISPKERGLRVRLSNPRARLLEPVIVKVLRHPVPGHPEHDYEGTELKPNELCKKFLGLKPRPTIEELEHALYPLGYNPRKHKGYVRGEYMGDKLWKLVRNRKWYNAKLEEEAEKRREYMQQVIESREKIIPAEAAP